MASVGLDLVERRRECRRTGGGPQWQPRALLRPGQPVTLINITSRAALLESAARLRPGAHTEVQLAGAAGRTIVRGRLERCFVAALDPLRYRGVIVFDGHIELGDERGRLDESLDE
jgi:hypothetical protein